MTFNPEADAIIMSYEIITGQRVDELIHDLIRSQTLV
jgi:hypothetical protein